MSADGSSGMPMRIRSVDSTTRSSTASRKSSWISSRLVAPQLWPPTRAKFEPFTTAAAALSGSTSSKIRMGFLPPSSRVRLLSTPDAPAAACTASPVRSEPVNDTRGTPGWVTRASPAAAPPGTTLNTPSGSRSVASEAITSGDSGVCSAGLSTTELPAASAGAAFIQVNRVGWL